MRTVKLKLHHNTARALPEEQLARLGINVQSENEKEECLKVGDEVLDFPFRLGPVLDRIQYELSGRDRYRGPENILQWNGMEFDAPENMLKDIESGKSVRLTDKEKLIVLALYSAVKFSLSRKDLLHAAWGYNEKIETHTLETHLYRLRQKIEEGLGRSEFIETGDGIYRLVS